MNFVNRISDHDLERYYLGMVKAELAVVRRNSVRHENCEGNSPI